MVESGERYLGIIQRMVSYTGAPKEKALSQLLSPTLLQETLSMSIAATALGSSPWSEERDFLEHLWRVSDPSASLGLLAQLLHLPRQ